MTTTIRPETPSDADAIDRITRRAFLHHPHSEQTEHFIVRALRADAALAVSLVAELDGRVVGHVAISQVAIDDGSAGWYGLGPIAVDPPYQGRGIGRALMQGALAALRSMGASGCVLVGDPALYRRFGFAHDPQLVYPDVPAAYFLALSLGTSRPRGQVRFHPAFQARG